MLKNLLGRFLGQQATRPAPDDLPAAPLTVMAIDTPPRAVEMIDVDNLYFPWLLGMGTAAAQDPNTSENRILRALKREADSGQAATADLVPRLPSVIPLLLRSLRNSSISTGELAAQLAQDAVLVAAALKQVNSSYFRRDTPVKTIEEAIAVLGQNGLRMLVASVAFKPLFNAGLGHFTAVGAPRIWKMAEPYEVACRYFARQRQVDGFELYLAGLLQNVGAIVALRILDQSGGAAPGALRSLAFYASFGHYARRLAAVIGRHWEFPDTVIAALDRDAPTAGEDLPEVLRVADRTAKIRTLVVQRVLREDHADACLEGDGVAACYREMVAADAQRDEAR